MSTDFLWVEEYRPKTIDDCILPASLKTLFLKSPVGGLRGYEETMLQDPEGSDFTQLVVAASFLRTI